MLRALADMEKLYSLDVAYCYFQFSKQYNGLVDRLIFAGENTIPYTAHKSIS